MSARSGQRDLTVMAIHRHQRRRLVLVARALERMGTNQLEILPVVSRADVRKLEGIVTLRDVLDLYGISPLQTVTDRP